MNRLNTEIQRALQEAEVRYRRHTGLEARIFAGASRPGMSGNPVLPADLGCFHGVFAFSDRAAAYPLAAGDGPMRADRVTVVMVPDYPQPSV